MPLRQRDINVAAFADRFAVVEGLQHSKQAAVFLQKACDGIKVARTAMPTQASPLWLRFARGGDRIADLRSSGLRQIGQNLTSCGIFAVESVAWLCEFAIDEVPKAAALINDPRKGFGRVFRGFTVVHSFEYFFDGHRVVFPVIRAPFSLKERSRKN